MSQASRNKSGRNGRDGENQILGIENLTETKATDERDRLAGADSSHYGT
jgi:hypothetical protein